jgi:hypothetical protein
MTYPPAPGQYPGSDGFPQQPGQYPGMPQYPGGVDAAVAQKPSGGTAIAAGVLGILGALFGVIFAILNFTSTKVLSGSRFEWLAWMQGVAYTIEVLTLGPGSILLFVRKTAGRWLVLTGSVVQLVQAIVALIALLSMGLHASADVSGAEAAGATTGGLLIMLTPAVATAILTLLPVTGRWLAWGRQESVQPYGQPPAYGPPSVPPGYGQPPGFGQPPGGYGQAPGYGQPPQD